MPNLMAYDVCGVQPMTGPTGLIFAMKSRYQTSTGGAERSGARTEDTEALFDEALTQYSGDSGTGQGTAGPSGLTGVSDKDNDSSLLDSEATYVPTVGAGMTTAKAEALGSGCSSQAFA